MFYQKILPTERSQLASLTVCIRCGGSIEGVQNTCSLMVRESVAENLRHSLSTASICYLYNGLCVYSAPYF